MEPRLEHQGRGTASGYPRPQLQRQDWINLNGSWDFALDPRGERGRPEDVIWNATIVVPFAPETAASGIGDTSFFCVAWYRRQFDLPNLRSDQRLLLHFGAVDYRATIWINGVELCTHEGGYTPFSIDVTSELRSEGPQEVVVRAADDPSDLEKPRGKQDWKLEPHSIWYPRTTGIWQTVWIEVVPAVRLNSVRWTSNMERWEIGLEAHVYGGLPPGSRLAVRMHCREQLLLEDTYGFVSSAQGGGSLAAGEIHRRIALSDPGIDDFRNDLLWSPDKPTIIDVECRCSILKAQCSTRYGAIPPCVRSRSRGIASP